MGRCAVAEKTGIAWTDATFNPWMGCTKVSPACTHCYAERDTKRFGRVVWGPDAERIHTSDENWKKPRRWNKAAGAEGKRLKVFCASLADVFEDRRDLDAWRAELWPLIEECTNIDWQLLTKRPEHVLQMVPASWLKNGFPKHVWMGATVENQEWANRRCPELIKIGEAAKPAVLFVSCEPLLGAINLLPWLEPFKDLNPDLSKTPRITWVIAGGESGAGFRPYVDAWVRDLEKQTHRARAAFFFKQDSGLHPDKEPMLDGVRYAEFPKSGIPTLLP